MCLWLFSERLSSLIPDDTRRQAALSLPTRDFEMAYRLDCRNLCADFCEDIEFRFSLGLGSLLRRFLGKTGMQRIARGYSQVSVIYLNETSVSCVSSFCTGQRSESDVSCLSVIIYSMVYVVLSVFFCTKTQYIVYKYA